MYISLVKQPLSINKITLAFKPFSPSFLLPSPRLCYLAGALSPSTAVVCVEADL